MYLFYVDESGNTGKHADPAEPVHWLSAVALHVSSMRALEADMMALALDTFGERAKEPGFEFHGSDLFSGRRECRGMDADVRVAVYRALAGLLAKHRCALFIRGIEKARHQARAARRGYTPVHPHTLAFQFLVEQMDEWLQQRQPRRRTPSPAHEVLGLVIADEQKEVGREVVSSFAKWRDGGTAMGYRQRRIQYLIDTVHHVPSTDSWLLQLTDCVAYLRNRYEKVQRGKVLRGEALGPADEEVVRLWTTHCAPLLCCDKVWP
ncbi:Protein of unknown function [bacterium JGI 053]|nr:Protein of unknown function [bacterium JGI 053]